MIYGIFNKTFNAFVRWGVNGGGAWGYCLFRGNRCFFLDLKSARHAVEGFDNPDDYEIREVGEVGMLAEVAQ